MKSYSFVAMKYQDIVSLIIKFVVTFAAFEYTLKRLGYIHNGMNDTNNININWSKYIKEIKTNLPINSSDIIEDDVKEAVEYIIYFPPQKEIILNHQLDYQAISDKMFTDEINWELIGVFVWRIRNNLFHGEKSPFVEANARDRALLFHAITLLNYFAHQTTKFCNIFRSRLSDISQSKY